MLKKLKFPDPLVLLSAFIFVAMLASHFVQSGKFDRKINEASGREIVVADSYHEVTANPVSFFDMIVAIPKGMQQAGAVIFFVFLVGGSFYVINKTGALNAAVEWIAIKFSAKEMFVIPICINLFASLGAIQNFQEEIIPLVPILLLLCKRLGFDNLTAAAISIGAAMVGAAFSPINPFQVGIAQKIADVQLLSGAAYRSIFLVIAIAIYIGLVWRRAIKTRVIPESDTLIRAQTFSTAHKVILAVVVATFAFLVVGVFRWDWDFEQMTALFFASGILCGIIGGLGTSGTIKSFISGFKDMAYAALLIGFARAIYVVLEDGVIIDSLVNGLFSPLSQLPVAVSLTGITLIESLIHFPIPSVSGQGVLTMPLLTSLADLLQVPRQLMILCYQYGCGLAELITPTNGGLMAILAACKVSFGKWIKFSIKAYGLLILLGLIAIYIGHNIGFS